MNEFDDGHAGYCSACTGAGPSFDLSRFASLNPVQTPNIARRHLSTIIPPAVESVGVQVPANQSFRLTTQVVSSSVGQNASGTLSVSFAGVYSFECAWSGS